MTLGGLFSQEIFRFLQLPRWSKPKSQIPNFMFALPGRLVVPRGRPAGHSQGAGPRPVDFLIQLNPCLPRGPSHERDNLAQGDG
jgi:hypothetical protein